MENCCDVNLILHAHQPYVRHLEYPKFLEENWLFESIAESYLPLLSVLERLDGEGCQFKVTISFSPTLTTMLCDEPLQERFVRYMQERIELGNKEVERCKSDAPENLFMAKHYRDAYSSMLSLYESLGRDILKEFLRLKRKGKVELMASAATHAFLPLFRMDENAVRAQVEVGISEFVRVFGYSPDGFWLPECGYYTGLERILGEYGIRYVQLPSHSVLTSKNLIASAGTEPLLLGDSPVYGFPRDWSLSSLVWSDVSGYPCDRDYREFYRDIGYDLPLEYIRPYIHEPDVRVFTGYKYFAITQRGNEKKPYEMDKALEKVQLHADNFLYHVRRKGLGNYFENGKKPIVTLCFDAELFGHRWFEGVSFLERLLSANEAESGIRLTTPSETLASGSYAEKAYLNDCSWDKHGYADSWLDGSNAWTYRHIEKAIGYMEEIARHFPKQPSLKKRFLNQAAREILLAMDSDWPKIMHDRTSVNYAETRFRNHIGSFLVVYSNMCKNAVNTEWLINAEKRNAIFPDIDYNIFGKESGKS